MSNRLTTEERLGQSPGRLVGYFTLVMGVVYLGLGTWLWWTSTQVLSGGLLHLGTTSRRVLGTVFIIYGLLRIGRGLQNRFRKKPFADND